MKSDNTRMNTKLNEYEQIVAGAILSVDTIWGGNVECPSGTGRVVADSYFSGKDLPECYYGPEAESLRKSEGVSAKQPDKDAIRAYIKRVGPSEMIEAFAKEAKSFEPSRRQLVEALAETLRIQLELGLERIGDGPSVDYERCVRSAMGEMNKEAETSKEREQVRELLGKLGERVAPGSAGLVEAVDSFRKRTWVGHEGISQASERLIRELERLVLKNFVPYLPSMLQEVPRSNVRFELIKDAWFSGSMNYIGRAKKPDGTPEYEAMYEINAKIEKSQAEFAHLVSHEVVPGHVTTFAYVQHLYHLGLAGFESTILTMNTRLSTLFEGIANTALLLAYGVQRIEELPSAELQLGVLLSTLEDAAKNNASYYTYVSKMPEEEIKERLRNDCLATKERAEKLTEAWAKHPLMGRAYMPSYRHGTELVMRLLAEHGAAKMIPVLYGAKGLVDCVTIQEAMM